MSQKPVEQVLDACEQLLRTGDYRAALMDLSEVADRDQSGAALAMMALTCFHLEDYAAAARHAEAALIRAPEQGDWQALLEHAEANTVSRVSEFVPARYYFDRETLLHRPANIDSEALPPAVPRSASALRRLLVATGNMLGYFVSGPMHTFTWSWGRLAGYQDGIWTNWDRRPLPLAILTLAYMRDELNRHNLIGVYPKDAPIGFCPKPGRPPTTAMRFRTADGSWNNLREPLEGAAGTRFSRNVQYGAIRPESGLQLMTPNPREISRRLLSRGESVKEVPFLNLLAAAWIQFQTHDWVSHGENLEERPHEIPLPGDDTLRQRYGRDRIRVGRTQSDPTRLNRGEPAIMTYINEVTHWWDGSQIYGSDRQTVDFLRSGTDGKLKLRPDGTLPVAENGVEATGFVRNWWVGLGLLHTLFAREHNAICDRLKSKYPHWDDERLFNVARLINAAVMAKIHTVEWTPAILPNAPANAALNANWYGLATNFLRSNKNRKTLAAINIRNPELGGVVGNPTDAHGLPFSLTEEFVEVYRLHSLLPEALELRDYRSDEALGSVPLPKTRQAGSAILVAQHGITTLLHSFGRQNCGALELNNFPRFMQAFSMPGNPLLDLGAVDILRARERGVPRYNEFRRQLQLHPIRSFADLTDNQATIETLREVYDDDIEALDLLIGTLAEDPSHRPANFGFGETLFQIFILNATRRLQTDRFYTTCYNAETYTDEGLDWIDDASFRTVLLRHYPELAGTGLANIRNAFEPWDSSERLDPQRHPLRAFDSELRPDPWHGDRWRDT